MAALNDRFWAKVLFKEFIRHYRKLTAEQIVADINASMDALEDLDDTGDSFGSKMVRWSMERADEPSAVASRENGKKGGRPRKSTADGDTREDGEFKSDSGDAGNLETATSANNSEARESQALDSRRAGGNSLRVAKVSTSPARSSGPMPEDKQAVLDYASAQGLDIDDAYECWHVTVNERGGLTADNKPINNWKAYVRKWCETRAKRRTA